MGKTEIENKKKEMYVLYSAYDDNVKDIWGVFDSIDELKNHLWKEALENAAPSNAESYLNDWTVARCELNRILTEPERSENYWRVEYIFSEDEVLKLKEILKTTNKSQGNNKLWTKLK